MSAHPTTIRACDRVCARRMGIDAGSLAWLEEDDG